MLWGFVMCQAGFFPFPSLPKPEFMFQILPVKPQKQSETETEF